MELYRITYFFSLRQFRKIEKGFVTNLNLTSFKLKKQKFSRYFRLSS